jgi:hypothetical protein
MTALAENESPLDFYAGCRRRDVLVCLNQVLENMSQLEDGVRRVLPGYVHSFIRCNVCVIARFKPHRFKAMKGVERKQIVEAWLKRAIRAVENMPEISPDLVDAAKRFNVMFFTYPWASNALNKEHVCPI